MKYYGLCKTISLEFIDLSISQWTIKQVLTFLDEINLKEYKEIFYENKIKGKDLVALEEDEMKQDLKMKLGDRKRLMNYIEYLHGLNKPKKNFQKKNSKNFKKRGSLGARTLTMRRNFEENGNMKVIMEKSDEEWQESESPDYQKDKKEKMRNFVTEDW